MIQRYKLWPAIRIACATTARHKCRHHGYIRSTASLLKFINLLKHESVHCKVTLIHYITKLISPPLDHSCLFCVCFQTPGTSVSVSGHPIDSRPFRCVTFGPPIPEIQFHLENSRSKIKVKCIPVSAASSWLIFDVFHISASHRLPSPLFHDKWGSYSWNTIWLRKFKVKGQGQWSRTKVPLSA